MSSEETATLEPETGALPNVEVVDAEEYELMRKSHQRNRDLRLELRQARGRVRECQERVATLKVEMKEAKGCFEAAVDRLGRIVDEMDQERLPFARVEPEAAAPPADDESWKDRPIRELELSPGILTKLEELGIDTIGKLEHLRGQQDPDYPRGLNSVKGFGEAKITLIEDAVTNWLDRNRDNLHALAAEEASPEAIAEAPPEGEVSEEQTEEEVEGEPEGDDAETVSMADHQEVKDPAPRAAAKRSAK